MRLMAMEKGMTVWSRLTELELAEPWAGLPAGESTDGLCVPPVHSVQNTESHVSQKSSS